MRSAILCPLPPWRKSRSYCLNRLGGVEEHEPSDSGRSAHPPEFRASFLRADYAQNVSVNIRHAFPAA